MTLILIKTQNSTLFSHIRRRHLKLSVRAGRNEVKIIGASFERGLGDETARGYHILRAVHPPPNIPFPHNPFAELRALSSL